MHAISGLLKLQSGEIDYCGQIISRMEAHKIIRPGSGQVPEGRRVFSGLTVQAESADGRLCPPATAKKRFRMISIWCFELLPRLKERRNQLAGTLSGGEQQMLAMGRALMCKPKMLLLDEPSMGLRRCWSRKFSKSSGKSIGTRYRAAGGAERQNGVGDRQPRLCAERPAPLKWKAKRPNLPTTSRCAKPTWAADGFRQ